MGFNSAFKGLKSLDVIVSNVLLVHGKNGYANAPEFYVVRTLPTLLVHMVAFILYTGALPQLNREFVELGPLS